MRAMVTTPTTPPPATECKPPTRQPFRSQIGPPLRRSTIRLNEILSFAYETFTSNKVRFALTALGMVIGTASLILVVTIGMTGKQYVLNQIQAIGANLIYAEYQSGAQRITGSSPDPLTLDDLNAALAEVPG